MSNSAVWELVSLLLLAALSACLVSIWQISVARKALLRKYSGIADAEAATQAALVRLNALEAEEQSRRETLNGQYTEALALHDQLKAEVRKLEENLDDISFGFYKPHFDFSSTEEYKAEITNARERQKELVKLGQAATCAVEWTVNNRRTEGLQMTKKHVKLALRTFNGECEAAFADQNWSNALRMEERISKSAEAINKLGEVLYVKIESKYLDAKLDELHLRSDYEQKRYQDREEHRRIREQIREEERAQLEMEKARADAESEESRFEKALAVARADAERATGERLEKLTSQVAAFEAKLDEARRKKERAISRAQLTRSGFVYVISNHGSFGERVFKIGMTRRMEPMDRIYELSGASVPFPYDLHAMLYSDDAPSLENALHQLFAERRFNLVNGRKEFFVDVDLAEIEVFVRARGLSAQFIKSPEAREYRQTVALREKTKPSALNQQQSGISFPEVLFAPESQP